MVAPDYQGQGLYNLMERIAVARGAAPGPVKPFEFSGHDALHEARAVVFWLIDGLGDHYLASQPDSTLAQHRVAGATSVFPATTTAALTTVHTGLAPRQHAATGWYLYLREFGACSTWLPFGPRAGRTTWPQLIPGAEALLERPALSDRMAAPTVQVLPDWLKDSPYTVATGGQAERRGYAGLDELVEQIVAVACDQDTARSGRYIYAYWPDFDSECHRSGVDSARTLACFEAVDAAFAQLLERLAGTGSAVVATADHGLIDTAPERVLDLSAVAGLKETLALPLCGEPRAAYAYLRSGSERDFDAGVAEHFGNHVRNIPVDELIDAGWFGPGPAHPEFRSRVGDRVLLPEAGWVVRDRLWNEGRFRQTGVHGGASEQEMRTPVIVSLPE